MHRATALSSIGISDCRLLLTAENRMRVGTFSGRFSILFCIENLGQFQIQRYLT